MAATSPVVAPSSATELVELLHKTGLFKPDALNAKLDEFDLPPDAVGAAGVMVRAGLLTQFQARLLLAGKYRGFKLGTYLIRDQIGKGGMGTVYLAEHSTLRRKVALKVLTPGGDGREVAVERFLREARAAAALDHPNIVKVFDVLQSGELHYLVLEYVEGRTLESLVVGGGAMAPGRAVGYVSQAAAGLQHAYEKGFVHRDIKPANLMVAKDGTVKILDMGLARSTVEAGDKVTELLDHGSAVGTADFVSPEQATNQPGIDIRADIYSLGATLYALIAGRPPFAGNVSQVLMQHQFQEPPSLVDQDRTIAPGLAAVVAKLLAKKPADRYATPADVIAALAPWLPNRDGAQKVMAGLSTSELGRTSGSLQNTLDQVISGSTRNLPRPASPPGRRGLWLGGGAAVAVLAAGVGGYAMLGGRTDEIKPPPAKPPASPTASPPTKSPAVATTKLSAAKPPAAKPPAAGGSVVYRLAAADVPPFRYTRTKGKLTSGSAAKFGPGVFFGGHKPDTLSEHWNEPEDGRPALGWANLSGPASGQLAVELERTAGTAALPAPLTAGRKYTIRLEYKTAGDAYGRLYFQLQNKYKPVPGSDDLSLPNTGGRWQTVELTVTKPADPIRLVVDNNSQGAANAFFVRQLVLTADGGGEPDGPATTFAGLEVAQYQNDGQHYFRGEIGSTTLPDGWVAAHYSKTAASQFRVADLGGTQAIGVRLTRGESGAQFKAKPEAFGPALAVGDAVTVRLTYRCAGPGVGRMAVQSDSQPYTRHVTAELPPTGDTWAEAELTYTHADGKYALVVEPPPASTADNTLWLKAARFAHGGAAPPAAAAQPAKTAAPVGARVYALNLSVLPTFRGRSANGEYSGEYRRFHPGLSWGCYKKESVAEFRGEPTDAGPALGVTNLNEPVSSQVYVQLDTAPGSPGLADGKRYVLRVEYRTTNDADGELEIRKPDYKAVAQADLPNTGAVWRWAEVAFTRPDGVKLEAMVNNRAAGEGNTLWLRAVELFEAP